MALINPVPTTASSLGVLAADTVFTCRRGMVGLTTDGGTGEDYYTLDAGERLVLGVGLTVSVIELTKDGAVLHHMPIAAP